LNPCSYPDFDRVLNDIRNVKLSRSYEAIELDLRKAIFIHI